MAAEIYINNTNISRFATVLSMESLDVVGSSSVLFIFIFGILTYCLILFCQSVLLTTIVLKRDLHKPMYILLCNLSVCDLVGVTAFFPQLLSSVLSERREIGYSACAVQGILIHLYGTGSLFTLTAMAYDRYIAICKPLRYHNLMTGGALAKLICVVWVLDVTLVGSIFALSLSKEICRTNIVDTYCNNPSILKLICEDIRVNNQYGLFVTAFIQGPSILIVSLTYVKILITCLSTKQAGSVSKAMQTCWTHLVVFLTFEINTFLMLISHRVDSVSPHLRRAFGVSILIFPPFLNPLIYGLNTREIRQTIFKFLRKKVAFM